MLLIDTERAPCSARQEEDGGPPDRLGTWALQLEQTRGHKKAADALAKKMARMAWAVWKTGHADHAGVAGI